MLVEDVANQLKLYQFNIHEGAKPLRYFQEVSNFQLLECHSLQSSICDGFQPKDMYVTKSEATPYKTLLKHLQYTSCSYN